MHFPARKLLYFDSYVTEDFLNGPIDTRLALVVEWFRRQAITGTQLSNLYMRHLANAVR